ncbi:MAG: PQQ-binding-like beta-propeller repeat protein [Deltaproteobacteria bacterium]|nr:PQQ-binding-like beta-propeller repeat protein [Deltaproteobacteria bacterium]
MTRTAEADVPTVGDDASDVVFDESGEVPAETAATADAGAMTCTESADGPVAPDPQRSVAWAPAANFGPVGTVELETDLTDRPRFLEWRDDRLLVLAGGGSFIRSYCLGHDATNPLVLAPEGQLAIQHADFPGRSRPVLSGDTFVHLSKDGILYAAALPSLDVLWEQRVADRSEMLMLAGAVRRSSDIVVLIANAASSVAPVEYELLGLARSDGNPVWRRSATSGSTLLAGDGRAMLFDRDGRVEGLQEGSGEVAWSAETGLSVGDEGFQLAGPHHVVVGKPGEKLIVLDADTGAEVSSTPLSGDHAFVPLVVLDDVLLAATSWQDDEGWQVNEVQAIDLATARLNWKSGQSFTGGEWPYRAKLVGIDDDVIVVQTPDRMLRVLDRATGVELASWRQAPEGCLVEPVFVRPVSTEPAMVLCLSGPTTVESLRRPMGMRSMPASVTVLARVAEQPEPGWSAEEATIAGQVTWRGRPKAGVRVRVNDRRVWTNAQGRFRVTLEARGMVIVDALPGSVTRHGPNDVTGGGPVEVVLDGRSEPYEVTLVFDDCGGDCD